MARISRRRFLEETAATGVAASAAAVLAQGQQGGQAAANPPGGLRLCRFQEQNTVKAGLYLDDSVVDLQRLARELKVNLPVASSNLLDYLPPEGRSATVARDLAGQFHKLDPNRQGQLRTPTGNVKLLVPIPEPRKVILLAGNYAAHVREGGGVAAERQETFPYFFWKPPSTTLTHPGDAIRIPRVSPDHVDWEIELGAIIGRTCRDVAEKEALGFVAGYCVCNDVSDRRFQINPQRKPRERDRFHDWLHGKWHDTFLPAGPCVRSAATLADPQNLPLRLRVNGQLMQDSNTSQMIFPVAALVAILSTFMTLEPGDIIVTGTPEGVGHARKPPVYLRRGDVVEAEIGGIGVLRNPVA